MAHLSKESREAIIRQALNSNGKGIKALAEKNNVGYSTLQRWLKNHHSKVKNEASPSAGKLSRIEQLDHIIATASLDETALGIYCRQQGIYSCQLQEWKDSIMKDTSETNTVLRKELKALKTEIKRLQKDLARKDKVLSETSALLVLKKKADLNWGINEDN